MNEPPNLKIERTSTNRYRSLWGIALAINILVAIPGIPYGPGFDPFKLPNRWMPAMKEI